MKFQYLPELHWKRFSPQLFGLTELVVGTSSVVELDFSPSPLKHEEEKKYIRYYSQRIGKKDNSVFCRK